MSTLSFLTSFNQTWYRLPVTVGHGNLPEMEEACFSKTMVYQTARCHIQEESNLHSCSQKETQIS